MDYTPKLIDNEMNSYINGALKQCNQYKINYYNWLFNTGIVIIFCIIMILIVYFSYTSTLSYNEKAEKNKNKYNDLIKRLNNLNPNIVI